METNRREFLATGLAGTAALLSGCRAKARVPGAILGASAAVGHRLRQGRGFPEPVETHEVETVIAGGGIAGLSAAKQLAKAGREFVLLELEPSLGGNSASGANAVSAYPWGAHYVPLPNAESTEVMDLFEELGLIRGRSETGAPIYEETALCADPMDRLFDRGRWQEGLVPQLGVTAEDRRQYGEFFQAMEEFRLAVGSDGRRAFSIPIDLSSQDARWRELDGLAMAAWMAQHAYASEPLRWYVDYCCRDDYGAGIERVSAWAGIHYFAGRHAWAANAPSDAVLTWPAGNGWLVQKLAEAVRDRMRSRYLVWQIQPQEGGALVKAFDLERQVSVVFRTRAVVCALPRFIAQRIIPGLEPVKLDYSPWMVANVTLGELPQGRGAPLAWDNVLRESRSLGYVVATHQNLHPVPRETVLTHYWPLDELPPVQAREQAIAKTHEAWCEEIVADLERGHRGIAAQVRQIDVWLWGHGMIRPVPGFIWGEARRKMQEQKGAIFFAHSDQSGVSIFEEAYTRGIRVGRAVEEYLG